MSAEVAAHVERPVRSLGPQRLRGLHDKVEVYALAEQPMEPRSQTAPRGRGQNGRDLLPPWRIA
jgi:hypothetical protein